jgi:hypothetical protein
MRPGYDAQIIRVSISSGLPTAKSLADAGEFTRALLSLDYRFECRVAI